MNSIFLDLGIIKIYWYSIMIFFAILFGGLIAMKEAKKRKIPEKFIINLFFYLIPISLIGARLYYVIFNFSYYENNILDIIKVWEGGLAIHGGILSGLIFIIIYCNKYKISKLKILDIASISLILGQSIGRWGNFFNGEAHGSVTTLEQLKWLPKFIINGMYIDGKYWEPTFLYESIWCLIGFILLLLFRMILKKGQLVSFYLIWYGIGRYFIESLRTDSLMFNNLKIAQVISVSMIVIGIIMFIANIKNEKYKEKEKIDEKLF